MPEGMKMSTSLDSAAFVDMHDTAIEECESRVTELKELVVHLSGVSIEATAAAMIVHEVAQPVTAATNFLAVADHLLSSGDPTDNSLGLDAVHHAQECLVRTGEVMATVKEAAEMKAFDPCPQDLVGIVADAMQMFEFEATMIPEIDISRAASHVMGDGVQLGQVISNLIRNALEATEGQKVRMLRIVSRRADKKFVELRIEDNGPGIPDKMRGLLFAIFSTTKPQGMGVGLSICRTIIEQHRGRIWSDPLPDGTAFCFTVASCGETSFRGRDRANRKVPKLGAPMVSALAHVGG